MSACFDTILELDDGDVPVRIFYDYSPGFIGFNIHGGPTDGAQPPEPREATEIMDVIDLNIKESILEKIPGKELEGLLEKATQDLRKKDEDYYERH